jgi:hypothetical protein
MRLSELICENYEFGHSGSDLDSWYNPELAKYADDERRRTEEVWEHADGVPVFTKDVPHSKYELMKTEPGKYEYQSPGYRGREEAKQRAGMKHKPYQQFDPNFMKKEEPNPASPR